MIVIPPQFGGVSCPDFVFNGELYLLECYLEPCRCKSTIMNSRVLSNRVSQCMHNILILYLYIPFLLSDQNVSHNFLIVTTPNNDYGSLIVRHV